MSQLTEAWLLNNTVQRCVLAKIQVYDVVATSDTFLYLSTHNFIAGTTNYLPIISGGLQFSESITINGNSSTSYGDLELDNLSGDYDDWMDDTKYIWVNRTIQLYYGDPEWTATSTADVAVQFELIFDGIIVDVGSRNRNKINIKVRDKMERLNTPVTETKLGTYGTWGASAQPNKDSLKPLVFGEVHNITPLLMDPLDYEYMANFGRTELVVEVRDNGVPVHTSGTLTGINTGSVATTGVFWLNAPPVGAITISVQGTRDSINLGTGALVTATYVNKVANLVALISTQYGRTDTKLAAADLDLANLSAFDTAVTDAVGILVNDGSTVRAVCGQLAESVGAQLVFSRIGKLQLLRIGEGFAGTITTITDNDIMANSLMVSEKIPVIAASKIGYCKNWTVQKDLMTGIPDSHKTMFAEEWMSETSTVDTTSIKALYKLNLEPEQKNTLLITTASAQAEANRLTNFYKTSRAVYTFVGTPRLQLLKLGQNITLTHNRFGLQTGKAGQVISLGINWSTGKVTVGVLV